MFFAAQTLVTVDIGSYAIKAVRMKLKKSGLEVLGTAYRQLPFEVLKEDKPNQDTVIANILKEVFQELKCRSDLVISTIPGKYSIIRNMELPVMNEDELAEAIKWEAEDLLPFPVDQAAIDFVIVKQNEEKIDLLITAAKKQIIEEFLNPFLLSGIKPGVINVQSMALISLLDFYGLASTPLAIIDFGASGTRVTIGDRNNIYLSRNIDTGGEDFTRLLMEEANLDYREAEDYKAEKGITEEIDLTGNRLTLLAHQLANEISRSLDYYTMKYREETLDKVYCTGGGFKLKGLSIFLNQKIGHELLQLNSFKDLVLPSDFINEDIEFAVATGLGISEVLANEG